MVLKIPPPPPIANIDPAFNRWLLELTTILNGTGLTDLTTLTAPTAAPGTNTNQIATTAFVIANTASSPSVSVPLPDATPGRVGVASTFARGDHVHPTDTSRAPLASPTFTGAPTAPTAAALTDTTQIATTAYADSAVVVETARAETAEALLAPLASPALTGSPTAPTQVSTDNSTKIATTAFVQAVAAGGGTVPVVKAAAFFSVSGGVVALIKSFNVTSVTRSGVGAYTVNITSALADANYYISATMDRDGTANGWGEGDTNAGLAGKTTTACPIGFFSASASRVDPGAAYVMLFE